MSWRDSESVPASLRKEPANLKIQEAALAAQPTDCSESETLLSSRLSSLVYLSEDLLGIEILIRRIGFTLCFFFLASCIYESPKRRANKWQRH